MANWFHRFLNPHCPHCIQEQESNKICVSCEILRTENARLQRDNEILLNRILERPEPVEERTEAPTPKILPTQRLPWKARAQALEAEDRERAKLLRNAPKADVNQLESELVNERGEKSGA
jgi:hypothetical protein